MVGSSVAAALVYMTTMSSAVPSAIHDPLVFRPLFNRYELQSSISVSRSSIERQIKEHFDRICALQENWDGYWASAISDKVKENSDIALSAFLLLGLLPELTPNANGTISFEWFGRNGDAHIEMGGSRYVGNIRLVGGKRIPISGRRSDGSSLSKDMLEVGSYIHMMLICELNCVESLSLVRKADVRIAG